MTLNTTAQVLHQEFDAIHLKPDQRAGAGAANTSSIEAYRERVHMLRKDNVAGQAALCLSGGGMAAPLSRSGYCKIWRGMTRHFIPLSRSIIPGPAHTPPMFWTVSRKTTQSWPFSGS